MQETLDLGVIWGWSLARILRERAAFRMPNGTAHGILRNELLAGLG
jgi:hypothetical protein